MASDLLSSVSSISSPLGLGGVALLVLAVVIRGILRLKIFPKFQQSHAFVILKLIVEKVTIVAIVAIVLAFVADVLGKLAPIEIHSSAANWKVNQVLQMPFQNARDIRYVKPTNDHLWPMQSLARFNDKGAAFIGAVGSTIVAAAPGVVDSVGYERNYGNRIVVDHGDELKTSYGHLSRIFVEEGNIIRAGERIGEIGSTGMATASHLRFSVQFRGEYIDALTALLSRQPEGRVHP